VSAVEADEKLDTWLLEHLDFEPPCSLPATECSKPAAWYLRMRCCGSLVAALCEEHKLRLAAEFVISDAIRFTWQCAVCSARRTASDLTEFIPVKAAS
jgi:hypothetical protein